MGNQKEQLHDDVSSILENIDSIVVESNEKDPIPIATITSSEVIIADGYRVRIKPKN